MRCFKTCFNTFVWQAGVGYLALWAITYWTLDQGAIVFGQSGVCHPDAAKVLFYWVCDAASPYAFLAALANFALTVTVWSPVYIAAATVDPGRDRDRRCRSCWRMSSACRPRSSSGSSDGCCVRPGAADARPCAPWRRVDARRSAHRQS